MALYMSTAANNITEQPDTRQQQTDEYVCLLVR